MALPAVSPRLPASENLPRELSFSQRLTQFIARINFFSTVNKDLTERLITFLSPYVARGEIGNFDLLSVTDDVDAVFWRQMKPQPPEIGLVHPSRRVMHLAISAGDVDLVASLIRGRITVEFPPEDECPPYLHYLLKEEGISFEARRAILKLLLENGADPKFYSPEMGTPLGVLLNNGSLSEEGRIELAEILIEAGAKELDQIYSKTDSLLSRVVRNGDYKIARFLIEKGANLEKRPVDWSISYLPIHHLVDRSEPLSPEGLEFLIFLLGQGVDPNDNARRREHRSLITPLSLVLKNGRFEVLPLLIEFMALRMSLAKLVEQFFLASPKLYSEIQELNQICLMQFFDSNLISPNETLEEQFAALPFSERLKYLGPLVKKVADLKANNKGFSEFLNCIPCERMDGEKDLLEGYRDIVLITLQELGSEGWDLV